MDNSLLWVEAWIDGASKDDFIYILVLRKRQSGQFEIVDPQQKRSIIASFHSYEEATAWLNEEEYDLVERRWTA